MKRAKLMPKTGFSLSGKRSVAKGMANSAVQPVSSRAVATFQRPSQSQRTSSPSSRMVPSTMVPSGFVTK